MELPACEAVIVVVPAPTTVTVFPETVATEGFELAKETDRPELAVALSVNGAASSRTVASAPKLMVCEAGFTTSAWITGGAASKVAFPVWVAVMLVEPAATMVTVEPETVATAGLELE